MLVLQSIILGIPQGALYGLMGFGIALIFRSVGTMNFAHGNAGMVCVFVAFSVFTATGSIILSILCGIIVGFLLGVIIDKALMGPIKHLSHAGMLMITLGLLMIFEGAAQLIWGTDYQQFPELLRGEPLIMRLGENKLIMPLNDLLITAVAVAVSIIIALYLKYAKLGIATRARAQDPIGAKVVGIDTNMVDSLVWGIGISISVLVGILIAPKTYIHPGMMGNMQIYGFTAGVLGGFESLFGAIAGGLILGILEKLVGAYISPDYQLSIVLIIIIIMLAVKPSGLFGKKSSGRV
ncbi:MAG: branched-chain amino acid ABC transporter permease [Spirochaetales bacterium]|nr:branched-chain amino acid ABC transporter permease [Spirochaetales bacterium]